MPEARTAAHAQQPDRVHDWFVGGGTAESLCGRWDVVEESLQPPRTPGYDTCRSCSVIASALVNGYEPPDMSHEDFDRLLELRRHHPTDEETDDG